MEAAGCIRADLHAHTAASGLARAAGLGLARAPESFTEPERLYDEARARGMDFVAITDHDTIDGAMSLAERGFDRLIVGEEATVRFPEDECAVHVLLWGVTPALHEEMAREGLREDVYALAAWLRERGVAHALAHPLCAPGRRFTLRRLERCALLFRCFETMNGAHTTERQTLALERFLAGLTPERIEDLSAAHGAQPVWGFEAPGVCAGSDDHALLNIGRTWTGVARANAAMSGEGSRASREQDTCGFLDAIMRGEGFAGGRFATPDSLARQVVRIGVEHWVRTGHARSGARTRALVSRLAAFAGVEAPRPTRLELWKEAVGRRMPRRRPGAGDSALSRALREALPGLLAQFPDVREGAAAGGDGDALSGVSRDRMAEFADAAAVEIGRSLAGAGRAAGKRRDVAGIADAAIGAAAVALAQAPLLAAMALQNRGRGLMDDMSRGEAERTRGAGIVTGPLRVALFTDTVSDVNGVSRFVRTMAAQAERTGRDLRVFTSTRRPAPDGDAALRPPGAANIRNFEPVLAAPLPRYPALDVVLPPFTAMLRAAERFGPDVIHVSTPGPVGLTGAAAAAILRTPIAGVCHTNFPAYVERLFEDEALTSLCERLLRLLYARFDLVLTRSVDSMDLAAALGAAAERTRPVAPGVDGSLFHPSRRDESIWRRVAPGAAPGGVKVLSVGRLSAEKNVRFLARLWPAARRACAERGVGADLIIVGDGPLRAELERNLGPPREGGAHFLGFRHGEELASLYASSDIFTFPSTTETLGQVAMEAQAAGLPALVSDCGGPREMVDDGATGLVLPAGDDAAWIRAIAGLAADPARRRAVSAAARAAMERFPIERTFEAFWEAHEEVSRGRAAATRGEAPATTVRVWGVAPSRA